MAKKNFNFKKINFDFDNLKETLTDTISTVADKVLDFADSAADTAKVGQQIAKLFVEKKKEESALEDAYKELGKLYYAEKGGAPEGGYAAACGRINAAKAAIAANNARIEELKEGDEEVAAAAADAMVVEDHPAEEPKAE